MRYDATEFTQGATEVLAYGTAVKLARSSSSIMSTGDLAHLELLAEIDALARRLDDWSRHAPPWRPAETCQAIVGRLAGRLNSLRVRLESPLIVATLGGTGTGKSSLINALAGAEVVRSGRDRPTTTRPALLCRPGLTPEMLGIDAREVDVVQHDLPALANLVLVDCPDPDTTDAPGPLPSETTLARLRRILPLCDVLVVTTTQQKYRSARVAEELAAAAPGARLVFVETHADQDADIRDDWRHIWNRGIRPVIFSSSIRWPPWPMPGRAAGRRGSLPPWSICSRGSSRGRPPPGFAAPTSSIWPRRRWKAAAAAWTKRCRPSTT